MPELLLKPSPPVNDPVLCSVRSKKIITCPGFELSGPRETLTSLNNDVEYSLPISSSKIFLLNIEPGCVFNSLFMTQSFVFPFLGFPSITNSPSESGNLIFTSDTIPS